MSPQNCDTIQPGERFRNGFQSPIFNPVGNGELALPEAEAQHNDLPPGLAVRRAEGPSQYRRDTEHIEKSYAMGGMPAEHGLAAALMVKSGFTGVEDILTGEYNYIDTYSADPDRAAWTRGLSREYQIMRGGIKRWPVGAPVQGPLHVLYEVSFVIAWWWERKERRLARAEGREETPIEDEPTD